jgi:lysyl-tRNA synthetase class 2
MTQKYTQPWYDLYSEQMNVRLATRKKLEEMNVSPYKNGFKPNIQNTELKSLYESKTKEEIGETPTYKIGGRVMLLRDFGKASFIQLDDGSDRMQIYVQKGQFADAEYEEFKNTDLGDIIYVEGTMFKTMKGELSLLCKKYHILTKTLRPLPEKFHGLTDPELCYRQRYLDMIMNPKTRDTLRTRSQIVRYIREYFYKNDYLEVETPMMHAVAGGATARPFKTHHNALDMELFLRIAPELHLKRLIVGGYPKVFEMNRCFRNEGLSVKHNPEFTSIEFYQAYATYEDLMKLTEELLSGIVKDVLKKEEIEYAGKTISFKAPFAKMTMREAVSKFANIPLEKTYDKNALIELLKRSEIDQAGLNKLSADKLMVLCFDEFAEKQLIQPTFITEFPTEISPLSRRNDQNPNIVDRFELFCNGWEIANAFSELNNPTDQLERFADQAILKDAGDLEATDVDYDYVRALEYGMAPTAGEGIGIDRLCMILTNSESIRDVLLFPLLKKEVFFAEEENAKH